MKNLSKLMVCLLVLSSCTGNRTGSSEKADESLFNYARYVNPLIGTSKMGHTFPGASTPFGMVQLSPQSNFVPMYDENGNYIPETYEYCAGYQYSDSTIIGFAHTNFSGTGHSDLGDILLMPAGGEFDPGLLEKKGDRSALLSTFSHASEQAEPGYYKVILDRDNIVAELTASERVGYHRYDFGTNESANIILDLCYNVYHHQNKNVWTFLRVENDSVISGYRQTSGWARTRKVFFAIKFSESFREYGFKNLDNDTYKGFYRRFDQENNFPEMAGRNVKAWFSFDNTINKPLEVKVALSSVSTQGAMMNLEEEIPGWQFEEVRKATHDKWNRELSAVKAETLDEEGMTTFYTALYHTMLSPILYEDVDGSYRGLDQNIHKSEGFTNYTIFSLWDTYRALHPLFNILHPDRNNDMIKSMLAHHDQSVHKMLPVWSHYANENWCMIGYHATSVIADAMIKGVGNFDRERALEACINTSGVEYFDGLGEYIKYGYFPDDLTHSSVSKTLEIAYNDWCIAQVAEHLGQDKLRDEYLKRSASYVNVWDKKSGYMRPKLSDCSFREDFDPLDTHGQGFIEGNAWNYGLYVPQDIEAMIKMMGGKEAFSDHLDSLFTMELDEKYIAQTEDITRDGIIGNYVHGNEPGHHIPYLYNWTDRAWKTQERVRMIMESMYGPTVEGLCGNDDAGQMSAWYIFSALGFYPVTPGSSIYAIGSPLVKRAELSLQNGKKLIIIAENQSAQNIYVSRITLNGKELEEPFLDHSQIAGGAEIVFTMTATPTL